MANWGIATATGFRGLCLLTGLVSLLSIRSVEGQPTVGAPTDQPLGSSHGTLEAPKSITASLVLGSRQLASLVRKTVTRATQQRDDHGPVPLASIPPGYAAHAAVRSGTSQPAPRRPARPKFNGDLDVVENYTIGPRLSPGREYPDYYLGPTAEPTVADRGPEILLTANWLAAFSADGGKTFGLLDPYSTFPPLSPSPGQNESRPFCCDQIALYSRAEDMMLWLLQYEFDAGGNALRLAVSTGNDIKKREWKYYDFTPTSIGNWSGEWFDYPTLTASDKFVYLTSNLYSTQGNKNFTRAVIIRIALQDLARYGTPTYDYVSLENFGSLRATEGALGTMYFASHKHEAALELFAWREDDRNLNQAEIAVQKWIEPAANPDQQVPPTVAPGPDGRTWLNRLDSRITAGWKSGKQLGFAWSSREGYSFKYPQVRVVVLDVDTREVLTQPHIWSDDFAVAYPAVAPDGHGEVGVSVAYGGGTENPGHAVGVLRADGSWQWDLVLAQKGTSGPRCQDDNGKWTSECGQWGDYLSIQPAGKDDATWVASGFSVRSLPKEANQKIELDVVRFRVRTNLLPAPSSTLAGTSAVAPNREAR